MIARVQPLTRTRAIRGLFDYRLREEQSCVNVGSVLRVPFGRSRTLGIVVELAGESELDDERLAEPDAVLDAALPEDLVALAGWIAHEYCSTMARALSLLLPPGASEGVRPKLALVAELTDGGRLALESLDGVSERQRELLAQLAVAGPRVASELGTPRLRTLEKRGLVRLERRPVRRRPLRHAVGSASATPPRLNDDQRSALDAVLAGLDGSGAERELLLHGVTSSGKTEVYLHAVDAALRAGRTAIVLVPEIALTPQVLGRFQARFGDVVAVMHSGLAQGERYDEWMRLATGEARVCVGPRSAVFAPLRELGLVIIDEEHESSYKHEGDPRYDARAVASRRAAVHDAVLLLGSATPRSESAHTLRRLRLPHRVDGRPLPPVEVLDMRSQHHPLHPRTRLALSDLRRAGGKGIVLLNRRGWSNFLTCRACGQVWMCPNCEVALVLHRAGFVACHHCGHREPVPECCPACASVALARHGAGTERLEEELMRALEHPRFPVLRLDADSTGIDARAKILGRFEQAPAGLLIGTQMVAKGHDFPDVKLGVVLDADQTLRFPDFRAEERTFALITQLAGRAGRGNDGRVLVQTLAPDARCIELAARHDSDEFLAGELERRAALRYPPFATLIRVVCAAAEENVATAVSTDLAARISPPGASVLGPAPLFRLRGRARSQLVIKCAQREPGIEAVGTAVDAVAEIAARQAVSVSVDVDPQ